MKTTLANVLHEATHRIPGVPPHDPTSGATVRRGVNHHPRLQNLAPHHNSPPRVLVPWQNWISQLVHRNS
jgi:hypothetical protein